MGWLHKKSSLKIICGKYIFATVPFNATGKFFKPDQYQRQDISYIESLLSLTSADIEQYTTKSRLAHQKIILNLLGWSDLNSNEKLNLANEVARHVKQQLHPKQLMLSAINYLIINKIALPSYHFINDIITDSYNNYEYKLLNALELKLTNEHTTILDSIISKKDTPDDSVSFVLLKKLIHSLKPMDIEESVKQFESVKKYFILFKPLINELNLSQQAIEYYSTWFKKASLYQLNQFKTRNKAYLYLLAFIQHQYYYRHDMLVDSFLVPTP